MRLSFKKLLAMLLMVASCWTLAVGQQISSPSGSMVGTGGERAAQYYIGSQNELLMAVNIWGLVIKPGQYLVPSNTDLMTLISVAGGPQPKARLDNVQVIRSSSSGSEVISVNINKFLKTGDDRLIPKLQPGDTVVISGSLGELTSQIVNVVAQLAIVANVYYVFFVQRN